MASSASAGLPRLPIPPLEDTCTRYLNALRPLQSHHEHSKTKAVVAHFLKTDGPILQAKLEKYALSKASYIEEFWYESYLHHSPSVVLNLNPFFILEDDPTPARGNQLTRAASLILASVGFIHDLRADQLEPDRFRGQVLDMYQYSKLFGSSRIPTQDGCQIKTNPLSKHVVILRRGQFYWFDVIDNEHQPCISEKALLENLRAIVVDADHTPNSQVAQTSIGLLTTETRPTWARVRRDLLIASTPNHNRTCLEIIDNSLFIVCLDGSSPKTAHELSESMLCGTYHLNARGMQVGTCINRWYDKLQIIVCADGQAGVNFEHSVVDGHTVLRFVGDVYTELILRFAKSINSSSRTLFHTTPVSLSKMNHDLNIDINPKKLIWKMSNELKTAIRFAETRLSDLICQNEVVALEFEKYGKNFITSMNLSPDAFVQMAFQVCYFSLYGRIESTYEPAMTKSFYHGRTEGIRSVSIHSVEFAKRFCSNDVEDQEKIRALRKACQYHQELTKECTRGLGQDRILYAMYSLAKLDLDQESSSSVDDDDWHDHLENETQEGKNRRMKKRKLPKIFRDSGYGILNHSILSTSNCGNPALRLFGFGPVVSDGYGIGYIIKEDGLSFVVSSKHLQTPRFSDCLKSYLIEIRRILLKDQSSSEHQEKRVVVQNMDEEVNGVVLQRGDGVPIKRDEEAPRDDLKVNESGTNQVSPKETEEEDVLTSGYGFFDSGEIDRLIISQSHRVRKYEPPIGTKLQEFHQS